MSIEKLKNLYFQSCRFSKSSYEFEFEGVTDEGFQSFSAGTSYLASFEEQYKNDAAKYISSHAWDALEKKLVEISVDEEKRLVIFLFENGKALHVWSSDPLDDNLLIIKNNIDGSWFPIL
jgi:hypothetical protein